MTDYKNLKLRASSNPHIRNGEDTRGLMLDVIIALMPALLFGVWHFGVRVAISAVVSVASAIFFEWLYRKLLHKPQMIGDLSAAVTGLLLSMVCPPELPVWMLVVGNFFAIFVVKQLYGGLGKNFLNPALAARAALVACYASAMTSWSKVDAATGATPMALLKAGDMEALTAAYPIKDMAIGFISGSAGEVSALMLLIGGVYLIVRKVISWQTPVAYIATVAVVTFLFPRGNDPMTFMLYNVLGGGLHGDRLCDLPCHQEGPAHLRSRLRPDHGVHPLLRLLSRGRVLLHPDHELLHLDHRQIHQAHPLRR